MDVRVIALAAFVGLGLVRIYELWLNRTHVRRLKARGATNHGRAGLEIIVAGQVLLFAGILLEGYHAAPHPDATILTFSFLGIAFLALLLRHWCILTLGDRWTMMVYTVDAPLVARGPYRFLRHPNYVAVFVELAALCAALEAWITLVAAGVVTLVGLALRVHRENAVLAPLREKTVPRQTS